MKVGKQNEDIMPALKHTPNGRIRESDITHKPKIINNLVVVWKGEQICTEHWQYFTASNNVVQTTCLQKFTMSHMPAAAAMKNYLVQIFVNSQTLFIAHCKIVQRQWTMNRAAASRWPHLNCHGQVSTAGIFQCICITMHSWQVFLNQLIPCIIICWIIGKQLVFRWCLAKNSKCASSSRLPPLDTEI